MKVSKNTSLVFFLLTCIACESKLEFSSESLPPGTTSSGQQELIIPLGTGVDGNWNDLASILVCPDPDSVSNCQFTITNSDSISHEVTGIHPCQNTPLPIPPGDQWTCTVDSSFEGSTNSGHLWISTSGAKWYDTYCSSCHGPHHQSAKLGASNALIQNAIAGISEMQSLSSLPGPKIQGIGDFLMAALNAPSGGGPLTGTQLYSIHCASCHGLLDNSDVRGKSASSIEEAIQEKPEMNRIPTLVNLTVEQITLISEALDF